MKLLVDSSVWIDYFNGDPTPQTDTLDAALSKHEVLVGDLILCEVLQGFTQPRSFILARSVLLELPVVIIGGIATALQAADNYRTLRQRGITVRKTIDCLIATYAISHELPVLYSDRDFDVFVSYLGLRLPD